MTKATIHNIDTLPYTVNSMHKTHGILTTAFPTKESAIVNAKQTMTPNSFTEVVYEPTGEVVFEQTA